jgi:hypothetical protein
MSDRTDASLQCIVRGKPRAEGNVGAEGDVQSHLGQMLRKLFEQSISQPLPQQLVDLLEALAAQDNRHPAVSTTLKDALLASIPNLRAFAFSLCGNLRTRR